MALHQIEAFLLPQGSGRVGKAAFTADAAKFQRIAQVNVPVRVGITLPFAGDDVKIQVLLFQRLQGA
ncbi:hypothetical protein D3C80_697370 [compost metagenome]